MRAPAVVALRDQAEAAARHGWRTLTNLARILDTPLEHRQPGPPMVAVLERMSRRALAGEVTLCPHLHPRAPAPLWWAAWAPGRLRCAECLATTALRLHGTAEDHRCDHCRRTAPNIHPHATQLPAVVIDLPGVLAGSGPITILVGLCATCHEAEKPTAGVA